MNQRLALHGSSRGKEPPESKKDFKDRDQPRFTDSGQANRCCLPNTERCGDSRSERVCSMAMDNGGYLEKIIKIHLLPAGSVRSNPVAISHAGLFKFMLVKMFALATQPGYTFHHLRKFRWMCASLGPSAAHSVHSQANSGGGTGWAQVCRPTVALILPSPLLRSGASGRLLNQPMLSPQLGY